MIDLRQEVVGAGGLGPEQGQCAGEGLRGHGLTGAALHHMRAEGRFACSRHAGCAGGQGARDPSSPRGECPCLAHPSTFQNDACLCQATTRMAACCSLYTTSREPPAADAADIVGSEMLPPFLEVGNHVKRRFAQLHGCVSKQGNPRSRD